MFLVYGKTPFLIPALGVLWERMFSFEMTCISFWGTSDLLVKHVHHGRKVSLIISYCQIGYDSNNLVFSELSLASSWFRKIFALDRYIDSETNWFLEYIKRLYQRVFFAMQFKNLFITDRFNIKKFRKSLEFLLLIIFQLFIFKVYCSGIKVSTNKRFLQPFSFISKVFMGQCLKGLESYECRIFKVCSLC